ncbi:Hypothetical protein PP7435_CHR1-0860 [Komagataella phaffii CBS 7435]|nr:GQ67_02097T0 [Komagataella phaffii]AOA65884.1 GQ68_02112T0 [Komagataella phaffii GS115]CAH2446730.1 Hypothetical protein BQ9382_C1-4525 [Komagataella phaffii CBS 7435]CCA36996.1 Hypothetical protein PP7435_CHR1-0860 [Komagataella phaffii CBS 7435]
MYELEFPSDGEFEIEFLLFYFTAASVLLYLIGKILFFLGQRKRENIKLDIFQEVLEDYYRQLKVLRDDTSALKRILEQENCEIRLSLKNMRSDIDFKERNLKMEIADLHILFEDKLSDSVFKLNSHLISTSRDMKHIENLLNTKLSYYYDHLYSEVARLSNLEGYLSQYESKTEDCGENETCKIGQQQISLSSQNSSKDNNQLLSPISFLNSPTTPKKPNLSDPNLKVQLAPSLETIISPPKLKANVSNL